MRKDDGYRKALDMEFVRDCHERKTAQGAFEWSMAHYDGWAENANGAEKIEPFSDGGDGIRRLVAGLDESAEFDERRLATGFLPLLTGDGNGGCAMPFAHAGKGSYSLHAASFLAKRRAANLR